ncbi:TonB family protein [Phenylobacterium sp.]|jgi:protein TonB|uniref:energy transducer TonB n=1 Tax=Phenylobacterium sp. TaxID=1871053 RepID=UPI002F9559D5
MLLWLTFVALAVAESAPEATPLTARDVQVKYTDPQLQRFFPPKAQRAGIEGMAQVLCTIDRNGRLADCEVVRETPTEQGFGGAALKMVSTFRIGPQAKDSSPTAGRRFSYQAKFRIGPPPWGPASWEKPGAESAAAP